MAIPSTPIFGNPTRVASSVAIKAAPGKIWAILVEGGSTASSVDIYNDIDSAHGDILIGLTAPFTNATSSSQSSVFLNLLDLGGVDFSIGMYAELAGTGAIAYIWYS